MSKSYNYLRTILSGFVAIAMIGACTPKSSDDAQQKQKSEIDQKSTDADAHLAAAQEALKKAEDLQAENDKAKQANDDKSKDLDTRESNLKPDEAKLLERSAQITTAEDELKKAQASNDEEKISLGKQKIDLDALEKANVDADATRDEDLKAREADVQAKLDDVAAREVKLADGQKQLADLTANFQKTLEETKDLMASKFAKDIFESFLADQTVPAFIGYSISNMPKVEAFKLRNKISALNATKKYVLKRKLIPNTIKTDSVLPASPSVATATGSNSVSTKVEITGGDNQNLTDTYLVEAKVADLIAIRDQLRADSRVNLVVVEPILRLSVDRRLVIRDRDGTILKEALISRNLVQNTDFSKINIDQPSTYVGNLDKSACKDMTEDCMKEILSLNVLNKTMVTVSKMDGGKVSSKSISMQDYAKIALTNTVEILDRIIAAGLDKPVLNSKFSLARKTISTQALELGELILKTVTFQNLENTNFVGYVDVTYAVGLYRDRAKDDFPLNPFFSTSSNASNFISQDRNSTSFVLPVKNRDTSSLPKPDNFDDHRTHILDVLNVLNSDKGVQNETK